MSDMTLKLEVFGVTETQKTKLFRMIADELLTGAEGERAWRVGTGQVSAVEYEDEFGYEALRVESQPLDGGGYIIKRFRRRGGTSVWREIDA